MLGGESKRSEEAGRNCKKSTRKTAVKNSKIDGQTDRSTEIERKIDR